jgi:hypothetical protein
VRRQLLEVEDDARPDRWAWLSVGKREKRIPVQVCLQVGCGLKLGMG